MAKRRLSTPKVAQLLGSTKEAQEKFLAGLRSRNLDEIGWERLLRLAEVISRTTP